MSKKYWVMKSEPDAFSIDDLQRVKVEPWNGVRNYQARNFMRDDMKVGDPVLFYHSNAGKETGVAGLAKVASKPYADPTQFDPESHYYDPKATQEVPRWFLVDVAFVEKFPRMLLLEQLKANAPLLGEDFVLIRKGNRLSVAPITADQYKTVVKLSKTKGK